MVRVSLALVLVAGLFGCSPSADPGADRLVDGPRWRPPPATPRPPTDPRDPSQQAAFTPPNTPVSDLRDDPLLPGPPLSDGALPEPWPDDALAVVARRV